MTDDSDAVGFAPFGFQPTGGPDSASVAPIRCACGITALWNSPRFGFLCDICYRRREAQGAVATDLPAFLLARASEFERFAVAAAHEQAAAAFRACAKILRTYPEACTEDANELVSLRAAVARVRALADEPEAAWHYVTPDQIRSALGADQIEADRARHIAELSLANAVAAVVGPVTPHYPQLLGEVEQLRPVEPRASVANRDREA